MEFIFVISVAFGLQNIEVQFETHCTRALVNQLAEKDLPKYTKASQRWAVDIWITVRIYGFQLSSLKFNKEATGHLLLVL